MASGTRRSRRRRATSSHALKALGVDTQLAIYTDEGHDVQQPAHQRDIVRRAVAWLDKYLQKGAS